ncbi:MAG: hypothetical protein NTY19_18595 [Planctomycetota bacterium]|nr:hypothetical protein [Planctomycetota bacterium]
MLTQDQIQREICEARERTRRDATSWRLARERAQEQLQQVQEQIQRAQEQAEERFSKDFAEGREEGAWLGRIRVYEEFLHRPPRPDAELSTMSADELRQLAEELRGELPKS